MQQAPVPLIEKPHGGVKSCVKGKGAAGRWRRNRSIGADGGDNHAVHVTADHSDSTLVLVEQVSKLSGRLKANFIHEDDAAGEWWVMHRDQSRLGPEARQPCSQAAKRHLIERSGSVPFDQRIQADDVDGTYLPVPVQLSSITQIAIFDEGRPKRCA